MTTQDSRVDVNTRFRSPLLSENRTREYFIVSPFPTVVLSLFGIACSSFVIFLSVKLPKSSGSFRYFMGNLALADSLFLVAIVFAQCHGLVFYKMEWYYTATLCTIEVKTPQFFGMCMIYALPLCSYNRYRILVLDKPDLTKKQALLLCCLPYLSLLHAVIVPLFGPVVYKYGWRCGYVRDFPLRTIFSIGLIICSYVCAAYFTAITVRALKKSFTEIRQRLQKTEAQLKEEKRIVLVILFQCFLPIINVLPMAILIAFDLQVKNQALNRSSMLFIIVNPVLDSLATIFGMKPYRDLAKKFARKWTMCV